MYSFPHDSRFNKKGVIKGIAESFGKPGAGEMGPGQYEPGDTKRGNLGFTFEKAAEHQATIRAKKIGSCSPPVGTYFQQPRELSLGRLNEGNSSSSSSFPGKTNAQTANERSASAGATLRNRTRNGNQQQSVAPVIEPLPAVNAVQYTRIFASTAVSEISPCYRRRQARKWKREE